MSSCAHTICHVVMFDSCVVCVLSVDMSVDVALELYCQLNLFLQFYSNCTSFCFF